MTIVKHRPHPSLVTPFDGFFNNFWSRDLSQFVGSDELPRMMVRTNVIETQDGFKLELQVPGFSKEDLKLNLEKDELTVSAEKKNEALSEGVRYTRREFQSASFKRSFRVPENIAVERIVADYSNGILTVTLPKSEPSKPEVRNININ
ncbi:MAG TPA: Hsp20/alpha crystallin family protein [Flavobacteriales bacterium]